MADVDEPIHFSAYDPQWPTLFRAEAQRISARLPTDIAVEHIGSTSVPGLLAKPIVDIMVGTEAHHDLAAVRAALVALGYEDLDEAGVSGRIYLRRRADTAFNIALVRRGHSLWVSNLALRDYLRTSSEARREYTDMKRRAVESGIRSLLAYSDFKSAILRRLLGQALESQWRASSRSGKPPLAHSL
jgi:GrpB-like predicted nucleotidyltransferase (UPF0157 family)